MSESFLRPAIQFGDWWRVEDPRQGTCYYPGELSRAEVEREHPEADPDGIEYLEGQYGARLSAPGFMDCTDWCVFQTEQDAHDHLIDTYGDDYD